jgi:hypothetical protein
VGKRFQELGDCRSKGDKSPSVLGKVVQVLLDIAFQFGGILNVKEPV